MKYELSYGEVWKTLSSVNVNEKTDKKMNLTYLSWAWAWGTLMEHYPFATYEFHNESYEANGTVMCNCTVKIGNLERSMFLPVMDYKNNSIANPTSRQISDTRMRCLVKALALFGLAHYIYAGEDTPDIATDEAEAKVVPVETKKFNFEKTGGETLSTNDIEDYLLILASNLKDPENVLHKKSFTVNRSNIQVALDSTSDDDTNNARLKKLISLYEVA